MQDRPKMGLHLIYSSLSLIPVLIITIQTVQSGRNNGPCTQGWSSTCIPGNNLSFPASPTPTPTLQLTSTPQPNPAYFSDPARDPRLLNLSFYPYNGETPMSLITKDFYTPNEVFYIRNNLPVPLISNISNYTLTISGIGIPSPIQLTFAEIQSIFPSRNVTAVLQCAGNRRLEMNAFSPVSGGKWGGGAIGNAIWRGADLRQVLSHAGFNLANFTQQQISGMHIQFEGLDKDPTSGASYGASIPLSFFQDANFQPILAYGMNGRNLSPDHGYPLRALLPGIVGARNVKWLRKIQIADSESDTPYQRVNYKAFSPSVRKNTVTEDDLRETPAIMQLPVNSYITSHKSGDSVRAGWNLVEGYAYSGGGRRIIRVELSQTRGQTWTLTNITQREDEAGSPRSWSWTFWRANVSLPRGRMEIWVKAVDNGYNQQPQNINSIWNFCGYLTNSYHKITLLVT